MVKENGQTKFIFRQVLFRKEKFSKKHRKIRKQFSSFYKSMLKFLDKFPKLSDQEQTAIKELYEEYKRMETEENKYTKLIDKNKLENIKQL